MRRCIRSPDSTGADPAAPLPREVTVRAERDGQSTEFIATVRIDTPAEAAYYRHGGILQYVLRQLLAQIPDPPISSAG